ncbi:type II secretion system protein [Pedobacter metabolipauper]|uniref:Prepilin-type N-terminal cleavage/methylation domain-containing protein n=1 Tax=Pedobacter metabolipauper TaxID=425513 RepID=A0A4R6T1N6_9SPHI|nr:hypothetical protein [Pedobacter metabolipauper]TDQ11568.1 hypothetical protein ATK78_0691 [Pedobacter metabolipauper]
MASLKTSQVRASTLIEVIVAMVIIMVVFVIGIGIYTDVIRYAPSIQQQQGKALASAIILESIDQNNWSDATTNAEQIVLQKRVVPYENFPGLLLITVTASAEGKEIVKEKRIVKRTGDAAE